MTKRIQIMITVLFILSLSVCYAADSQEANSQFDQASGSIQKQLEDSLMDLTLLRDVIAAEKVPLSRKLSDLEEELINVRKEYQQTSRLLDSRTLDLSNLRSEIKSRQEEATYLSNLLGEYIRNFESRLHIAEIQRYRQPLEEAKLAADNSNLSEQEVYEKQAAMLTVSLDRLYDALGGVSFEGTAVNSGGLVKDGTFVMIGPAVLFSSTDGQDIGTAEQRLGSLEPAIIPFADPLDTEAVSGVIAQSNGTFPLDPTLGNAHKIEEIKETIWDEVQKGGVVMYPIFALAGAALLVALLKLLGILFTWMRTPSQKRVRALLKYVAVHDEEGAVKNARKIGGPVGRMLRVGVEHVKEPRELIEEVMYEQMMDSRLKLERFLPFVAISAASAPLLGLLGTVTGIINTFALITVFGSGDVKSLSGGISEALITTKYGLIVAIPSLLCHAFLSRMAKSVVNQMEKAAVALVNQVSKTPFRQAEKSDAINELTTEQVENIMQRMKSVKVSPNPEPLMNYSRDFAGGRMDRRLISIPNAATVAEAISKIRSSELKSDIDAVYVVDDQGKYIGNTPVGSLLIGSEEMSLDSLAQRNQPFVRVDTRNSDVQEMLQQYNLSSIAVLDHEGRLVGQVHRNGNGDER